MRLDELVRKAEEMNLTITPTMKTQFGKYLDLLVEWNGKIDLSAITEESEMVEKHFYDCLLIGRFFEDAPVTLLDLGSGAGFPGIPLKILFPRIKVILLEPTTKRTNFLNLVIKELGLADVAAINERAEEHVRMNRERYDFVSARAVARLNILLELAIPLLRTEGLFIAMKGNKGLEELSEAGKALKVLKCEIAGTFEEHLPTNGEGRQNILIRKKGTTDMKYPRQYGVMKNRPL